MEAGEAVSQADDKSLSVVGQELEAVPAHLAQTYGATAESLDLSHNAIRVVDNLQGFTRLKSLIVDSNQLQSKQAFPKLETLQTLCVNDNEIDDIDAFIDSVAAAFPNLTYLSMLKNPACPNYFIGKDQDDYQRYRYYMLHRLPNLKFLDSSPVSAAERQEAQRVGQFMKVARPASQPVSANLSTKAEKEEADEEGSGDEAEYDAESGMAPVGYSKASYGVCRYVYHGKQSEGNRFILNSDL